MMDVENPLPAHIIKKDLPILVHSMISDNAIRIYNVGQGNGVIVQATCDEPTAACNWIIDAGSNASPLIFNKGIMKEQIDLIDAKKITDFKNKYFLQVNLQEVVNSMTNYFCPTPPDSIKLGTVFISSPDIDHNNKIIMILENCFKKDAQRHSELFVNTVQQSILAGDAGFYKKMQDLFLERFITEFLNFKNLKSFPLRPPQELIFYLATLQEYLSSFVNQLPGNTPFPEAYGIIERMLGNTYVPRGSNLNCVDYTQQFSESFEVCKTNLQKVKTLSSEMTGELKEIGEKKPTEVIVTLNKIQEDFENFSLKKLSQENLCNIITEENLQTVASFVRGERDFRFHVSRRISEALENPLSMGNFYNLLIKREYGERFLRWIAPTPYKDISDIIKNTPDIEVFLTKSNRINISDFMGKQNNDSHFYIMNDPQYSSDPQDANGNANTVMIRLRNNQKDTISDETSVFILGDTELKPFLETFYFKKYNIIDKVKNNPANDLTFPRLQAKTVLAAHHGATTQNSDLTALFFNTREFRFSSSVRADYLHPRKEAIDFASSLFNDSASPHNIFYGYKKGKDNYYAVNRIKKPIYVTANSKEPTYEEAYYESF